MRRGFGKSLWGRLLAAGILAAACLPVRAANPFRDVPPDHWSLRAVEELARDGLIEGFPDGTFKGKKVVTRYDMAVHLAKLLARVDALRAAGKAGITPEDAVTVTRLTNEYKQELDLLGVKVDALETRIGAVERTTARLDKELSNVRVEGLYKIESSFVDEPYDFTRYPHDRSLNPYDGFDDNGLRPLKQEVFLRFYGNPYGLDGLNKNVETFAEIRGLISGVSENRLEYRFSDPPIAGDDLDDFATDVVDDKRVQLNKAHLNINSKRLKLRLFAEEAITDFAGPAALLTAEGFQASINDDFSPEQGIEASGVFKKLAYNASIIKDFTVTALVDGLQGNDPADLNEEFAPEIVTSQDAFGLRLQYETHRADASPKNRLIFGSNYVETVQDYDAKHAFNRVIGFDGAWEHRSSHTVDASMVQLFTEGRGDVTDTGFIFDASWEHGPWQAIGKHYSFGFDYQADLAELPWVDLSVNRNFRRPGGFVARVRGERLARLQLKYRADDKLFRNVKDLVLQGLYEEKWWEPNPRVPAAVTDDNEARRVFLQAIADLTDKTHVELKSEYIRDFPEGEDGEYLNTLNVDVNLFGETSLVADLEFGDDFDSRETPGDHYSRRRGQLTLNSQITKELFAKGYVETIKNDDHGFFEGLDRRRDDRNGRDVNRVGGEMAYAVDADLSFKVFGQREELEDDDFPLEDGTFDRAAGEVSYHFTRALQLRYVRGIQDLDFVRKANDYLINNFGQLKYQPTEATEVLLTYGFEYEAGGPPNLTDKGPLVFDRTNKVLQLTAQTDF